MSARDRFGATLKCPVCGRFGRARLSQLDGFSYLRDKSTSIDEIPEGFTSIEGRCYYASDLDIVCVDHPEKSAVVAPHVAY